MRPANECGRSPSEETLAAGSSRPTPVATVLMVPGVLISAMGLGTGTAIAMQIGDAVDGACPDEAEATL